MPVERRLSKILAMPDDDFFRWRANAREVLADHGGDAKLSALYEASGEEFDARARRAWAAGHGQ
jgi:hypothetical protein